MRGAATLLVILHAPPATENESKCPFLESMDIKHGQKRIGR
jgi:hypothetical protein